MDKLIELVLKGFTERGEVILGKIGSVLRELFLIRYANQVIRMNLKAMSFDRCIARGGTGVSLDTDEYLRRYLGKNAKLSALADFVSAIQHARGLLTGEPRHHM